MSDLTLALRFSMPNPHKDILRKALASVAALNASIAKMEAAFVHMSKELFDLQLENAVVTLNAAAPGQKDVQVLP